MSTKIEALPRERFVVDYSGRDYIEKLKRENRLEEFEGGKMWRITKEEYWEEEERRNSAPRTLCVDRSEIVNNIYFKSGDNITFEIDGMIFTNEEMKACKEVVKNAISFLPTPGSDLDYENYASMGIAANMVAAYASENLTKGQAEVLRDSFAEYMDGLIQEEKERQSGEEYYIDDTEGVGTTGELNKYYALRSRIPEQIAEARCRKLSKEDISPRAKAALIENIMYAAKYGSVVQSASNKQMATEIMELFQKVDLKDKNAVNRVLDRYREMMTPAYKAYGLENTSRSKSLANVLAQDVATFGAQIAKAKMIIDSVGKTCDYSV